MLFAARECARIMLEEGMDALIARHELHGRALLAGIQGDGAGGIRRCHPQDE